MKTLIRPAAALLTVVTSTLLPACDLPLRNLGGGAFAAAVPTRVQLAVNVPGAGGSGQALRVGSTSEFYELSRNAAVSINGGVLGVFDLVDRILALPPTSIDDDQAVWGPSQPQGLERNSFRFTVVRVEEGRFAYQLDARPKASTDDADFVTVFEGEAFPGDDDRGHGELDVHWGALRSLDDTACMLGDVHVVYAADAEPRTLDVDFTEAADGCRDETPTTARYHYEEASDAAGSLDYVNVKNIHRVDESKPLDETIAVRARWQGDGAGRADVRVSGGEITSDLQENLPDSGASSVDFVECWDANFSATYVDTNPDALEPHLGRPQEGDAATCVYADASFAEL